MSNAAVKRLFAIVLALTMCVSLLPVSAAAEETPTASPETKEEEVAEDTQATVSVTFVCEPSGTTVSVLDAKGEKIAPQEDGSYKLAPGEYTYTASCAGGGYTSAENVQLVIDGSAAKKEVSVTLEAETQEKEKTTEESNTNNTLLKNASEQDVNVLASGDCGAEGSSLTWSLDNDGVLTISGTGAMKDYGASDQPWAGNAAKIKEVIINSGVTAIGSSAFYGCSALTSVNIADSVTSIGGGAFTNCSALTSVTIPASVTKIGDAIWNVFDGCTSLLSINVDAQNQSFTSKDGILYDKAMQKLLACPAGKTGEFVIPSGINSIATCAAIGCSKLTAVTIPNSVTTIGFHAFQACRGLTKLTIPASVTSIGSCAFSQCDSLTEIEFCHSKGSVLNFETLGALGSGAFGLNGTTLATTVKVPDAENINTAISSYDWGGSKRTVTYKSTSDSAAAEIIGSGDCGAEGDNLKWTLDKNGVLTISGEGAMKDYVSSSDAEPQPWDSYAEQIKEIVIADGVTTIGTRAFSCLIVSSEDDIYKYSNLTKLTIADSVTSIGELAFCHCNGLTAVTIPCNVKNIGTYAFADCYNLTNISVDAANQYYTSEDGVLYNKAKTELLMCLESKEGAFSIPNGVQIIKDGAFNGCTKLTAVTIPNSVTTIGNMAFLGCNGLTDVTIPNSVTSIGNYAFQACFALEHLSLPASVTNIGGSDDFTYCWNFVSDCYKLSNIDVDSANAKFASKDGVVYNKDLTELLIYPQGKTGDFVIPDGVQKIGRLAFSGYGSTDKIAQRGLTKVTIPSSVKSIGYGAFAGCAELTQITIPESVTSIEASAFASCTSLKNIRFLHSANAELAFEKFALGGAESDPSTFWVSTNLATTVEVHDVNNVNPAISGYNWAGDNRTVTYAAITDSAVEKAAEELVEIVTDKVTSGSNVTIDIDGKLYTADENGSFGAIEVGDGDTVLASVSGYNTSGSADTHSMYPTSMEVYLLCDEDGEAKVKHIPEFDDLLRYSGCSIRITGNKGIRMITSVDGALKSTLINGRVEGYTLEEYGTLLCFSSEMVNGSLCLEDSYARHNYAYSRANGADPVFKYSGSTIQYTNVLVGFSLDQCKEDIAMRPYIVLSDAQGNRHTVYGGIVYRSVGYIAYQNRNAFSPSSSAYDYIWDIIHHVYGDKYDAEYQK